MSISDKSTDIKCQKSALRRQLKIKRAAAFKKWASHGEILCESFTFAVDRFSIVAAYYPMGSEANIFPLLQKISDADAKLCLPRVNDNEIDFYEFTFGDELQQSNFGVQEPLPNKRPLEPNIFLVPLLGFDKFGYRIGYGKGYYDRAIRKFRKKTNAMIIGIAFDEQEVESIPIEEHDMRLDFILTPSGIRSVTNPLL